MPSFIEIGKHWLNVDSIQMVDVEDYAGKLACKIHFDSGGSEDLLGEEAKQLIDLLKKNKVA